MRKIKYLIIVIVVMLITGCTNYDMSMKINKNKSMEFTLTILSDDNSEIEEEFLNYKNVLEQHNYSIERYNTNNKHGVIITKFFDYIDDVSKAKKDEEFNLLYMYNNDYESESKMFYVEKKFTSNRYIANFYIDLSNLDIDLSNAEIKYSVEFPDEPESSNTNLMSEDRKTLSWNIKSLGKTEIDYVFVLNNYDYIYYIAAFLIVIYLLVSIVNALLRKSGDNNNDDFREISDNYEPNNYSNNFSNNNLDDDKKDPKSIGLTPLSKEENNQNDSGVTNFYVPDNNKEDNLINRNSNVLNDISYNNVKVNNEFNTMVNNIDNNKSINNSIATVDLNNIRVNNSYTSVDNVSNNEKVNKNINNSLEQGNVDNRSFNDMVSNVDNLDKPVVNLNNKIVSVNNDEKNL